MKSKEMTKRAAQEREGKRMKLCKDCKFWEGIGPDWIAVRLVSFCGKEDGTNPVNGRVLHARPVKTALQLRKDEARCGMEGRWFEPKSGEK